MLGCDIILYAIIKTDQRVLTDSEGECADLVMGGSWREGKLLQIQVYSEYYTDHMIILSNRSRSSLLKSVL